MKSARMCCSIRDSRQGPRAATIWSEPVDVRAGPHRCIVRFLVVRSHLGSGDRGMTMNSTTMEGQGQSLTGNVKEGIGKLTGDDSLKAKGAGDQVIGDAKQVVGAAKDAIGNRGPIIDKAKAFAKERPWATAALVGTLAVALINTFRGK